MIFTHPSVTAVSAINTLSQHSRTVYTDIYSHLVSLVSKYFTITSGLRLFQQRVDDIRRYCLYYTDTNSKLFTKHYLVTLSRNIISYTFN